MTQYLFLTETIPNFYRFGMVEDFDKLYNILNNEKLLFYTICLNPENFNDIYNFFKTKYALSSVSNEIFEGNLYSMIEDINNINHIVSNTDDNNTSIDFYNGNNNYFKILYIDNVYKVNCLDGNINLYNMNYLNYLINNKVLELNKIYNVNDDNLIDKICKNIKYIKIENIEALEKYYNNDNYTTKDRISILFSNYIINKQYPVQIDLDNRWNNYECRDFYTYSSKIIKLIKINDKLYEIEHLKTMIPYIINFSEKSKEYYFLNIFYGTLGENSKYMTEHKILDKKQNVFNPNQEPWKSEKNMLLYINNYKEFLKKYDLKINIGKIPIFL
jgi:hypothetical protein